MNELFKLAFDFIVEKIGDPSIAMNIIFVHSGIRPAFLFQPIDVHEDNIYCVHSSYITTIIMDGVKILNSKNNIKLDLISQGLLIYNNECIQKLDLYKDIKYDLSGKKLGTVLGYESSLDDINTESRDFAIDVDLNIGDSKYCIYSMICIKGFMEDQKFLEKIQKMNEIVKLIDQTMYIDYKREPVRTIERISSILKKVKEGNILDRIEFKMLSNELWNHGFYITIQVLEKDPTILTKTPYKEYIVSFIAFMLNDPIKQFYPLSQKQLNINNDQIKQWEQSLFM